MPDYAYIHKELQRSGVTLNLLWLEYCDQCRATGQTPYQSTQFNKYYSDYLAKTNATMHLNHKPGEIMQVDWAGDTASVIDTDTGEIIPAYVFVATLPYCRLFQTKYGRVQIIGLCHWSFTFCFPNMLPVLYCRVPRHQFYQIIMGQG